MSQGFRFPATRWARAFTLANDLRRRALAIYYGDSGIFIRRDVYQRIGGFRPLPILEDYDLVRRMEQCGRTAYIRDVVLEASARRFAASPARTLAIWAGIQAAYSAGVPADRLARFYADVR